MTAQDIPATAQRARLTRDEEGGKLLGVCSGFARYTGVDVTLVRIFTVVLVVLAGAGGLLYLAAAAIMPHSDGRPSWAEEILRNERGASLLGIGMVAAAVAIVLGDASFHIGLLGDATAIWLLLLTGGAALVYWDRRKHGVPAADVPAVDLPATDAPTATMTAEATTATRLSAPVPAVPKAPRKPSFLLPGLAALIAAAGATALLDLAGVFDIPIDVALAGTVLVLGAMAIVGVRLERRVGGLVVIGLLLLPLTAVAAMTDIKLSDGFGDRSRSPLTVAALPHEYRLAAGDLDLDLTQLALPAGTTTVRVHVGAGKVDVHTPTGVPVRIDGNVGAGEATVFGALDDGTSVDLDHTDVGWATAAKSLKLEIDVAFGEVNVLR